MKATILDTVTGKTAVIADVTTYEWEDGNYSCDCNRNPWDIDTGKPDGVCEGAHRFLVIAAEPETEDDYPCTLRELNAAYPKELVRKFLDTLTR